MSAVDDFIATYGSLANNVAMQTGLSQSEVLGQWGLETGWGSHFAGQNNLGNVSPGGVVANYSTPQEGATAYVQALQQEGINTQVMGSDPAAFANALQSNGYAPAPYASPVLGAINTAQSHGASSDASSTDGLQPDGSYKVTITGTSTTPSVSSTGTGSQAANGSTSGIGIGGWLQAKLGDIGLIIFGLVIIAGVVLISQKKTVIDITRESLK